VDFQAFRDTLQSNQPPDGLSSALVALWHDGRGDWDEAHRVAQDMPGPDGAWIHAYLHRKEGDTANAAYWYRQAGRAVSPDALDDEWRQLVVSFLGR
jgi:hypothetical protein